MAVTENLISVWVGKSTAFLFSETVCSAPFASVYLSDAFATLTAT